MVSNEEFANRLRQSFSEQRKLYSYAILNNAPKNIDEYRYKAGVLGGLAIAERELEELLEAYREANDE